MTRILSIGLIALLLASPSFADKNADKRAKILKTRDQTLERLYEEEPDTRREIQRAEGYAVFSNIGVNLIFLSAGGGSGVVHDNVSGKDTYMNMGSAGVGLGLGVKDFRAVFVFHSRKALTNFINSGWDFSGQADAAAKSTDKGAEGSAAASLVDGVSVYQMTEAGLALQATLQGTKYWVSDSLN
ncbi:MAG: YSC84-related protein [Gammaproteobacteria bacterium]|nr:YSC84-related protein [Gammaproteobacteria bacterium]